MKRDRTLVAVALAITALAFATRFSSLSTRRFDPDELEHAHVAWYISQGHVPYRDFFEMHPPVVHYLMAGVLGRLDVQSADGAMRALFLLRKVACLVSVGIVVCTWILARRFFDSTTAWVSVPILTTDIVMSLRGPEIRPDGLAAVCWLVGLIALDAAIRSCRPASRATRLVFVSAGLCIGAGTLTSQKLLLAGPSLAVTAIWYMTSHRFGANSRVRVANLLCQVAGTITPCIVALAYFAAHRTGQAFVRSVLLQGLSWHRETSAGTTLTWMAHYDPWLFALAAGGACVVGAESLTDRMTLQTSTVLLLVNTVGVFFGLFLTPVPFPQYCLTFTPLLAVLGAAFLVHVARGLESQAKLPRDRRTILIAATAVFAALGVVGLVFARPVILHPLVYPAIVAIAGLAMVLLPIYRRPELALSVVLLALAVYPAQWTRWMIGQGDGGQFAELRYVMAHSAPDAILLDGWSGDGVFRQSAWYYWMLHPGVRAMLPRDVVDALESGLKSGTIRPDLVVLDSNLRALSDGLTHYVESHYRASGVDDIYVAK